MGIRKEKKKDESTRSGNEVAYWQLDRRTQRQFRNYQCHGFCHLLSLSEIPSQRIFQDCLFVDISVVDVSIFLVLLLLFLLFFLPLPPPPKNKSINQSINQSKSKKKSPVSGYSICPFFLVEIRIRFSREKKIGCTRVTVPCNLYSNLSLLAPADILRSL